jgi:sec-independent protein translocase protein TatB
MFNIGPGELMAILAVALIVLGPNRLPEAVRTVGRVVGELRRISSGFQDELRNAFDDTDVIDQLEKGPTAKPTSEAIDTAQAGLDGVSVSTGSLDGTEDIVDDLEDDQPVLGGHDDGSDDDDRDDLTDGPPDMPDLDELHALYGTHDDPAPEAPADPEPEPEAAAAGGRDDPPDTDQRAAS